MQILPILLSLILTVTTVLSPSPTPETLEARQACNTSSQCARPLICISSECHSRKAIPVLTPGVKNMLPPSLRISSLSEPEKLTATGSMLRLTPKELRPAKMWYTNRTIQSRAACIKSRQCPLGMLCNRRMGQCIERRDFSHIGKQLQGENPPGSKPSGSWDRRDLDKVDKEFNAEGVDSINDDEVATAGIDAGASNNDVSEPKTLMARSYCRTSDYCPRSLVCINCPQHRICIHSKYCGHHKKSPVSPKRPGKGRRDLAKVDEAINAKGIDADADNDISESKTLMARKSCRTNTDCPRNLACVIRGRSRVCQALRKNIWYGKPPLESGKKAAHHQVNAPIL